jgi:hypothetical protein
MSLIPIPLLHPERYGVYDRLYGVLLLAVYFLYATMI